MRPCHRAVLLLTAAATMALLPVIAGAQSPSITAVTPELIAAAKKEGQITFYSTEDIQAGSQIAKAFEARYPGINVEVQRSGAERAYQRVMQEYASNIHNVDFVSSSNRNHFVQWKKAGLLAPFATEEMKQFFAELQDPDATYFSSSGSLCVISYNTKQLRPEDAPKSFADLLDPKWKGKMVKGHPGYSGLILNCTYLVAEKLGWDYLKKLGQQDVMQTQSSLDPPRKVVAGERMVGVDGGENSVFDLQDAGEPIGLVYPAEGTPGAAAAAGIMKDAPHPNAARLFAAYFFGKDAQQALSDRGYRVFHPGVTLKAGRKPLSTIKTWFADPTEIDAATEEIKKKYAEDFGT